jgi:tetratricopeptide (TPR) repeat protein
LACDLGHPGLEAAARCNLGIALDAGGDAAAAAMEHERAVALVQALGDRRSEGLFCGYWALALARLGRHGEAARHLEAGRRLLEEGQDLISLGSFSCSAAECELLAGNPAGAAEVLAEAQRIADGSGAEGGSELRRGIERVKRLLGFG